MWDHHAHLIPTALRHLLGIPELGFDDPGELSRHAERLSAERGIGHLMGAWRGDLAELARDLPHGLLRLSLYIGHLCGHAALVTPQLVEELGLGGMEGEEVAGFLLVSGPSFLPLAERVYSLHTREEKRRALRVFLPELARRGISGVTCFDGFGEDPRGELELILEHSSPRLPLVPVPPLSQLDLALAEGLELVGGDLWLDGSIVAGSACLSDTDCPLYLSDGELVVGLSRAAQSGLTLTLHAIGARAIDQALRVLERVRASHPQASLRIEHACELLPLHLPKLKRLGVVLSMQPAFNLVLGREYARRVGRARAARLSPVAEARRAGIKVLLGSDAFVTPMRPEWIRAEVGPLG